MQFIGKMEFRAVLLRLIVGSVMYSLLLGFVLSSKVCTNSGVHLSHSLRSQYSRISSLEKQDLANFYKLSGADHMLTNLIPRKILTENRHGWNILDKRKTSYGGYRRGAGDNFLKEVSLHDVRLDPSSIHGRAQQTNLEYLLLLDVDRLVWSFRKTAGLNTPGEPFGGWETPSGELRGHFVGHFLSASAKMWASTHNADLHEKMSSLVFALSECQTKMGTGYLSAFPSELFDRFEALEDVWAPYYTIHKILAGLLDQYTLARNRLAFNITIWMADYFHDRVKNVITKYTIERHWLALNEETGGMNEVLYKLYSLTGDRKHFWLAHLFDKPCFLGLLALQADDISGFHSNTHIPIVIGSQMRYEITGEPLYREIGTFFMNIINSSHSYATGGTSVGEFWVDPRRVASHLGTENQESCTTYNMLKVSRHLFKWTKEMAYADYYERALTNGVLSIQRGREPGVMIYMLPLRPGSSKARSYHGWGTKFNSFWCCYGTGIESFSKLGDSIYFDDVGEELALYIIQYISSLLDWKSGQIAVSQFVEPIVSSSQRLKVTVKVSKLGTTTISSTLKLRIPLWTNNTGSRISVNGEHIPIPSPGNFLSLTKIWDHGDEIILDLIVILRSESIKDDRQEYASVQAFFYGPYLLAGFSSGDWDIKVDPYTSLVDFISPVPADYNSQLVTFVQTFNNTRSVLANANCTIKLEAYPDPGTDSALFATFRLIATTPEFKIYSSLMDAIGQVVMLEPFDLPGMVLSHKGEGQTLRVSDAATTGKEFSSFRLVSGLNNKNGSVSLESQYMRGCFASSYNQGLSVTLKCSSWMDTEFQEAASFLLESGISEYHSISFVAKGITRSFLMAPLLSLRDEAYTVYFNVSQVR